MHLPVLCLFLSMLAAADMPSPIPADHPLRRAPVLEPIPEGLPKAELLASPEVRTLLGYSRRAIHLPDGDTMVLFSYSQSAAANWMFLIKASDMSVERFAIPNNDIASHSSALGTDGTIYITPYATSRAYRFEVATRSFNPIPNELPSEEYTWEAWGGSNGRIYFGTWPNAYFGEYDPASGKWELWRQVAPETKYVTNFSETPEGRIRFRAWGPAQVWHEFDPASRSFTIVEAPSFAPTGPPLPAVPGSTDTFEEAVETQGRRFAVSMPGGGFWELPSEGPPTLVADTQAPAEQKWWLKTTDREILGVSYFGALFRYELATGAFTRGQLDNRAAGGNSIMFLESITPNCVIGANYSQQNLFAVDPVTGAVREPKTVIARVSGEPFTAVGVNGMAFIGVYVHSLIMAYDPAKDFAYNVNPREIAELQTQYKQTRPRASVTDGRFAYMTSDGDYNVLGGALTVIDPETISCHVYHQIIADQNLTTLAYDAASRLVWGGTDRWGQMHSHPPTQESSCVYAFNPESRKVEAQFVIWPESDVSLVLGVAAEGILIVASGDRLALVDTRTREVLFEGPSPYGTMYEAIPSKVRIGSDGNSYCLVDGTFYCWDFKDNRMTPLASAPGCRLLTEPQPGLWVFGDSKALYSIRLAAHS
ncbi:MAG: hypothetical protein IT364_03245 [Candidatus Hydrogenedentes bacterium]|nr:hypothetical protein [Candidatus Hydrogenedentota bacterium]